MKHYGKISHGFISYGLKASIKTLLQGLNCLRNIGCRIDFGVFKTTDSKHEVLGKCFI